MPHVSNISSFKRNECMVEQRGDVATRGETRCLALNAVPSAAAQIALSLCLRTVPGGRALDFVNFYRDLRYLNW
jgi:hypothetical protein